MGVMVAVGVIAASIIGTAISQLLADEFKAWAPWLVDHLIQRAVRNLRNDLRDRMDEEWRAYIEETPGTIGRIWNGIGLVLAARRLCPNDKAKARLRWHPVLHKTWAIVRATIRFFPRYLEIRSVSKKFTAAAFAKDIDGVGEAMHELDEILSRSGNKLYRRIFVHIFMKHFPYFGAKPLKQ